jgi:hypothetical protein
VRSNFPCSKFDFLQRLSNFREIQENLLQRLSDFLNGFPISSTAFDFFNGFPIFLNGFPLSEKSRKIYLWQQVYERLLSELRISAKIAIFCEKIIGGKNMKDHYPSFVFSATSSVILANNCHSSLSLASVEDMYVKMAFN